MTGYGRVSNSFDDKVINVEVRSLNSKYTDIRVKIPQNYKEKEHELRKIVSDKALRGKIEITIEVETGNGGDEYGLNEALFRRYHQELSRLTNELQIPTADMLQAILRLPNVVGAAADTIDDKEWAAVHKTVDGALAKFTEFRTVEGNALKEDLLLRVNNIASLLARLDPEEEERITKLRQRMRQSLEEHLGKDKVDDNRFEQEILFYLEKIDITEEKVRLEQHCKYFIEELEKQQPLKGRKLSFISQEMGREINTMGAKAYSSNIQKLVVEMKDELEKIKEQVANTV
ncbi:YicC family protein [Phaeodactylibacter luteus]|uniref:YicC family protein n=2 Tax=Phaeodactylibacter luteus TaxID=1564516 RepID=A0A5C6RW83_9BACT|nr:YicC family protein [Phaeodactylibacter luteus]